MTQELRQVKFHGRGGKGVWLSSKILAIAAMYDGFNIKASPYFGPERMGEYVTADLRYSRDPIKIACEIETPDCVIVLEPNLFKTKKEEILKGLEAGKKLIANYNEELNFPGIETHIMDVSKLAVGKYRMEFVNVGILGGYIRVMGDISLDSLKRSIMNEMTTTDVEGRKSTKAAEVNISLMEDVYHQMK
jgi:pyruvate ferredoxin oxidoreductase gamma subunit